MQATWHTPFHGIIQNGAQQRVSVCFLESTGSVKSAGDPISGPRLLFSVPGALGLEKNNCNEVLPERLPQASTETIDALAHRICDDRYVHFRGSF